MLLSTIIALCSTYMPLPRVPMQPALTYTGGGNTAVVSDAQRAAEAGYGFEGGRVVETPRGLYLFTAEFQGWPINANMRVAIWRSASNRSAGPWVRRSTIVASQGNGTSIESWNRTCSASNLHASPWAPFPVYDDKSGQGRWHVHLVSYACNLSWSVRVGVGNIVGYVSTQTGAEGIEGPYEMYGNSNGVIIGPSAVEDTSRDSNAIHSLRWGDLTTDCAACHGDRTSTPPIYCMYAPCRFDNGITGAAISMSPFALSRNASVKFGAFVGLNHDFAWSNSISGPWTIGSPNALGEQLASTLATSSSPYCENPVVTRITVPGRTEKGFVAVFDTVSPTGGWVADPSSGEWKSGEYRGEWFGFGLSFSYDGVYWSKGVDVRLPGGCRTPLGLIEYVGTDGELRYEMLFTRRFADCSQQTLPEGGRGDANNDRTMCANLYSAMFAIQWKPWGA